MNKSNRFIYCEGQRRAGISLNATDRSNEQVVPYGRSNIVYILHIEKFLSTFFYYVFFHRMKTEAGKIPNLVIGFIIRLAL